MRVTAVEFVKQVGAFMDRARLEPVTVTKSDRDHVVVLAAEEYERLLRRDRQVVRKGELTAEERAAIAAAEVPPADEQRRHLAEMSAATERLFGDADQ